MQCTEEEIKVVMGASTDQSENLPPVRGSAHIKSSPTTAGDHGPSLKNISKKSVKPREYRDWDK